MIKADSHITLFFSFTLTLLLLLVMPCSSQVKDRGIPFITHHSKKDYRGGAQNWDFVQDSNNILYVANNQGVLRYDGLDWDLIQMPNRSVVRCLFKDDDGRIYVGAYNEFGYLAPDSVGRIAYVSLKNNISDTELGEFWKIHHQDGYFYFQTYDALVIYNKDIDNWQIKRPDLSFGFLHQLDDHLFINNRGYGLMEIMGEELSMVKGGEAFADWEIWTIAEVKGEMLIATQNNGIFILDDGDVSPWSSEVNEFLLKNRFFSFEQTKDNLFWGSIQSGMVVSNYKGEIVNHLNKNTGLNNNTILSLYIDTENTLWMGLDNGIDQVYIHSPISFLRTDNEIGAGYCATIYGDRIYLGTNQGLFWIPKNKAEGYQMSIPITKSIPECSGQVWALKVVDGELLVGHNRGTFAIRGDKVRQVYAQSGGWNFNYLPHDEEHILQGTYNGMVFYKRGINGLEFDYQLDGINQSSRIIHVANDNTIWMGHGYEGIFKIRLSRDLKKVDDLTVYGESSGLGTDTFNELFKVGEQILVGNATGFFFYNETEQKFMPAESWTNSFIDGGRMTGLIPGIQNDYFYFQEEASGHLRIFSDTLFIKDQGALAPLSQSYIPAFENLSVIGEHELLIGTTDGFVHFDVNMQVKAYENIPFHFKNFESLRNNSDINFNLEAEDDLGVWRSNHPLRNIPYRDNDLKISFVATSLTVPELNHYQYILDEQFANWSPWSTESSVDFTNLREGEYLLKVRAKNANGKVSPVNELYFHILTPWYRSLLAYISYFLVLVLVVFIALKVWNDRIEKEKRRTKILEERRMLHKQLSLKRDSEQAEKEIVKLRNDKLRADIRHKSKELANQTMSILQKNRFLTEIKEEMLKMKKKAQSDDVKNSLHKMLRKIDRNIEDESAQKVFETNFDQVHETFLLRLREAYPSLSAKDLRLCAYLRLNLSSKEIAPLLNISIRGVEISRYRLRKKLNLEHDESLADFIMRF